MLTRRTLSFQGMRDVEGLPTERSAQSRQFRRRQVKKDDMKITAIILATASLVAAAAPVQAQIVEEAYAPADSVFQGFRAEAQVGYDRNAFDLRTSLQQATPFTEASARADGASFGGELGYDAQFDRIVVGAYVGGEYGTAKLCGEVYGTDDLCIKAKRNLNAGARLGYAFGSDALVYVKGGYSNGRVTAEYIDFATDEGFREGAGRDGYHFGGGIEFPVGRFYVKGEYVHVDYANYRIDTAAFIDAKRDQGKFGIGYRF